MRYTNSLACAVVGLGLATSVVAQAAPVTLPPVGTKMVYVNTGLILPVAPGAEEAQSAFQAELAGFQAELESLAGQIDSMLADYRRQESLLDAAAKDAKQKQILDLQQAAQNRQLQLEGESEQRRAVLLEPILDNIRTTIENLRVEQQYSIVFDIGEAGIIAADSTLDITNTILQRLGVPPGTVPPNPGS